MVNGTYTFIIIDPNSKKSNQPFTEEGRYFLTFNGEIYNYKKLKLNLVSRGFKFKTNSGRSSLYPFKNFNIESVLNLIKGMFAFVFDKKGNSFIAARDHFGQKHYIIP